METRANPGVNCIFDKVLRSLVRRFYHSSFYKFFFDRNIQRDSVYYKRVALSFFLFNFFFFVLTMFKIFWTRVNSRSTISCREEKGELQISSTTRSIKSSFHQRHFDAHYARLSECIWRTLPIPVYVFTLRL